MNARRRRAGLCSACGSYLPIVATVTGDLPPTEADVERAQARSARDYDRIMTASESDRADWWARQQANACPVPSRELALCAVCAAAHDAAQSTGISVRVYWAATILGLARPNRWVQLAIEGNSFKITTEPPVFVLTMACDAGVTTPQGAWHHVDRAGLRAAVEHVQDRRYPSANGAPCRVCGTLYAKTWAASNQCAACAWAETLSEFRYRSDGATRAPAVLVAIGEYLGIPWAALAAVDVTPFNRSGAQGTPEPFGYLGQDALTALRELADRPAPPEPIVLDAPTGPRPLVRFREQS